MLLKSKGFLRKDYVEACNIAIKAILMTRIDILLKYMLRSLAYRLRRREKIEYGVASSLQKEHIIFTDVHSRINRRVTHDSRQKSFVDSDRL